MVWTLPENIKQYANTREAFGTGDFVKAPTNLDIDASLAGGLVVLKGDIPIYGTSGTPWTKGVWTWTLVVGVILLAITVYFW